MPDSYDRDSLHERAAFLGNWDYGFATYVRHFFPGAWAKRARIEIGPQAYNYRSLCNKYDIVRGEDLELQQLSPGSKDQVCNVCLRKWAAMLRSRLPTPRDWPYRWLDRAGRRLLVEDFLAHKDWVRLLEVIADLQGPFDSSGALPVAVGQVYYADQDWSPRKRNTMSRRLLGRFERTGAVVVTSGPLQGSDPYYRMSVFGEDVIVLANRRGLLHEHGRQS